MILMLVPIRTITTTKPITITATLMILIIQISWILNLINEQTIENFPDGVVIANAARGEIIDDEAMIKAMKSGKVFALGLDVYRGEPSINTKYLELQNLFLLPHLGSATSRTRIAMGNRAIDNLDNFLNNNTEPKDKVN